MIGTTTITNEKNKKSVTKKNLCRDGEMFKHILNFMRTGRPILPENFTQVELLLEEAKYFELPGQFGC